MMTENYCPTKMCLLLLCVGFALVLTAFQPAFCGITPDELTVTLSPGGVVEESKTVDLPIIIPKGDIIFGFDLTGSMGGAINTAKAEAVNIMNSLDALIGDSRFGVTSYMDYPHAYSSCGYSTTYGASSSGDYAYSLDHALSNDRTSVSSSISSLVLGYGGDGPQDYTRVMYESYADPAIEYRSGAKKILINFGDNIPHDCDINEGVPGTSTVVSTGGDPGRDEVMGTSDDLDLQDVLAGMAANEVTLLEVHTSTYAATHWDYWTGITGGEHFILNSVSDIPSAIYDLIQAQAVSISNLTLVASTGYESWLTSVSPAAYTNLELPVDPVNFDISITVPEGTPPGTYTFYVSAMGDGASYGDQLVTIEVTPPYNCYLSTPDPVLVFEGTEDYEANGQLWTRYLLTVTNWADYPDEMFELTTDLGACGLNDNPSRSWVDIFTADDSRIYGFCALEESTNLQNIWFAVPRGDCPPEQIYIEIDDRRCEITYTSNLVPIIGDITGTVSADCPALGTGLLGVEIDLYNADGDLVANAITDVDGYYEMLSVFVCDYTITIVTPLGYQVPNDELPVTVIGNEVVTVDFALTCREITAEPRTIGFWKHQTGVATGGKGSAQIDAATLCGYLDDIEAHFNGNAINQVIIYQPPGTDVCDDKLLVLKSLMNLKGSVEMIARARQQLMALLLNVAGGKLSQTEVISADGATVSQAITYCDNVIDDLTGNYEAAKTIADEINNNREVPAGMIPLTTANIAYRQGAMPVTYSLSQNYPNPFNPVTTISFSLPVAGFAKLDVYNIMGQRVATLVDRHLGAGEHTVTFDGRETASGVYFYRLSTSEFTDTQKMVLLK